MSFTLYCPKTNATYMEFDQSHCTFHSNTCLDINIMKTKKQPYLIRSKKHVHLKSKWFQPVKSSILVPKYTLILQMQVVIRNYPRLKTAKSN